MQDAALSVVMNLAASTASREYINDALTIKVLSCISEYPRTLVNEENCISKEQIQQMNFQCLKAVSDHDFFPQNVTPGATHILSLYLSHAFDRKWPYPT
jgi:hypothetical protein